MKLREKPIRIDDQPDPNAKEDKCRRIGHTWSWDKVLRRYVCSHCKELDR